MILRYALSRTATPVARRCITTTPLALASRHARSRPPVRVPPRRHAAASQPEPATEALVSTSQKTELPPVTRLPVEVPHDEHGVLDLASYSGAARLKEILAQPALVIQRQLEMMNVLIGYEQANKYTISSPEGELLGYLMEEDGGIGAIKRQLLKTHRPFKATVLSKEGQVLLIVRRPFAWINSRIFVCTPLDNGPPPTSSTTPGTFEPLPPAQVVEDQIIGETQQVWHLYRREYSNFLSRDGEMQQFASIDAGFLAWDFVAKDEQGQAVASINRNFGGFAREIFTDTGAYVIRFEGVADEQQAALDAPKDGQLPAPRDSTTSPTPSTSTSSSTSTVKEPFSSSTELTVPIPSLSYDARAVILATAVTADIDYFSRHSGHGGMGAGFMPVYMPGMGGGGAGAEGEAGAGAGAGAGAEGAESAEGEVGRVQGENDAPVVNDDGGWNGGGVDGGGWGGWGSSSPSGGGDTPSTGGSGGWGDEVMRDPWASNEGQAEEGGTWGWGDFFPNGDE